MSAQPALPAGTLTPAAAASSPPPSFETDIAPVAALIADRTRAAILGQLLAGPPVTAGELARRTGVGAATASSHLAKLLDGGLVTVEAQGRHRFYRLAGPEVADVLETLARISPPLPVRSLRQARETAALRAARTCYDHLAGRAGVVLLQALLDRRLLAPDGGAAFVVTAAGERAFHELAVDLEGLRRQRRPLTRSCLDGTERRPHLAGGLGAALTSRFLELGWFTRRPAGRALSVTDGGRAALADRFGWTP